MGRLFIKGSLALRQHMGLFRQRSGMELVQVAIMVAIAVALGLIFRTQITDFVNRTFEGLDNF
jgi:hypothetical protein